MDFTKKGRSKCSDLWRSLEVGGGLAKNRASQSIFKVNHLMMSSCLMRAKAIFTGKCEATSRGPREPVLASRYPEVHADLQRFMRPNLQPTSRGLCAPTSAWSARSIYRQRSLGRPPEVSSLAQHTPAPVHRADLQRSK